MIKPISKKKYYETISEQIEQAILSGEWAEGSRVPTEDELAGIFQVGRGSIREAITNLQMSGILVSSPGIGTYVADNAVSCINNHQLADMLNDPESIDEMAKARKVLEPQLASYAAHQKAAGKSQHFGDPQIIRYQTHLVRHGIEVEAVAESGGYQGFISRSQGREHAALLVLCRENYSESVAVEITYLIRSADASRLYHSVLTGEAEVALAHVECHLVYITNKIVVLYDLAGFFHIAVSVPFICFPRPFRSPR